MGTPCILCEPTGFSLSLPGRKGITYTLGNGSLEHGHDVLSLDTGNVESFGPALENTLIDVILGGRVRECETQRQGLEFGQVTVVSLDELLKAGCDVLP